jgi:hypothetical protein
LARNAPRLTRSAALISAKGVIAIRTRRVKFSMAIHVFRMTAGKLCRIDMVNNMHYPEKAW